jgi:hypothetical protein
MANMKSDVATGRLMKGREGLNGGAPSEEPD